MDQRTVVLVLEQHGMESRLVEGELLVLDVYTDHSEWVVAPLTLSGLRDWLGY